MPGLLMTGACGRPHWGRVRLVAATFTATNRQQPDTVAITATLRLKLGLEAQRMVSASGSLAGDVADRRNVLPSRLDGLPARPRRVLPGTAGWHIPVKWLTLPPGRREV